MYGARITIFMLISKLLHLYLLLLWTVFTLATLIRIIDKPSLICEISHTNRHLKVVLVCEGLGIRNEEMGCHKCKMVPKMAANP
jgi:hypothetical protein